MTATIVFFAVLAGIVIFVTLLLTLCALQMSANIDRNEQRSYHPIVPNNLLSKERRKIVRDDFPIACNDGSYAWVDRRRTAVQ